MTVVPWTSMTRAFGCDARIEPAGPTATILPFDVTTDQFACGVCDGPASTVPPAKIVSGAGTFVVEFGIVQAVRARKSSAAHRSDVIRESYRNSALRGGRCCWSLRIPITLAAVLVAASASAASFSAADVPSAHIRHTGKVVIRNDRNGITAYHFFGDIRESLFSLRSMQTALRYTPFGAAVFNSSASVTTPMPAYLSALIADASKQHGVDPRLVAAIAARESAYNPAAVSPAGAAGVMQLMPATARFVGVDNVFDARQNVFGGVRYLRTLLDTFHGDLNLTLAAYNAGPGAVQKYNGVPPYRETRDYVRIVRTRYEAALKR